MKIIGAGYARTGTNSMQNALNELGFPCYHMFEVMKRPEHIRLWYDFYLHKDENKRVMDWDYLFGVERDQVNQEEIDRVNINKMRNDVVFTACMDFPSCLHFEELLQKYPDAKVILTVRDPKEWHRSWRQLADGCWFLDYFKWVHIMRLYKDWIDDFLLGPNSIFGPSIAVEDNLKTYHAHVEKVKEVVPPEKLLIFSVGDGWEPLCKFLDVPVPDKEFPRLNAGVFGVQKRFLKIVGRGLTNPLIVAVTVATFVVAIHKFMKKN